MYTYDVALSFAGEDRDIVREIAKKLKRKKLKVFYDEFEETNLLGKDLYQYLHYIYKEAAIFCVVFISSSYMKKLWTHLELRAAQNRAFLENTEYILPLQLEPNIQIPGLADTIGYLDVNKYTTDQIVKIIYDKVCTVKPTKEYEYQRKKKLYDLIFETFDFIIERYVCFGNGSKIAELACMRRLIEDYKRFLLEYAQEINRDLYSFLLPVLKELEGYAETGMCFVDAANLKSHAMILRRLYHAFKKSKLSDKFDFYYYIYQDEMLNDRDTWLKEALKEIAHNIQNDMEHPIEAIEYIRRTIYLLDFDIYFNDDEEAVYNFAYKEGIIDDVETMLKNSEIYTHDENNE